MKTGVVLSGGASKCVAHLGAIKAMKEMGIKIDLISASSGGALFGSLVAAGKTPDEALDTVKEVGSFNYYFPSIKSGGLFSMSRIESAFANALPVSTFEELKIPMVIATTDIINGEVVFFSKGPLIKPIIASSSYPAIFEPVHLGDRYLLDGGIINNFPVEPLMEAMMDVIIGISVGKVYPLPKLGTTMRVFVRSLELAINEHDLKRFKHCDILIEPPGLNRFGMFSVDQADEIFISGYDECYKHAAQIETMLRQPPV